MKFIKKYFKYFLVFIFILLFNMFLNPINLDEIWNYGFSYAISRGEIPYLDFNMVITPLFPFIMSIPLIIFGKNLLVLHISNSIMFTFLFYFIFKNCKDKSCFLLLLFLLPIPLVYSSYNIFLLLLFILLIEYSKNDYLLGLIIGLMFLTKQSVGGVFCLVFIFLLFTDRKKFVKSFISFLIPNIIFLIYLLITNSFSKFFDLCFLGLIDFTGNSRFNYFIIIGLIIFVLNVYKYLKSHNYNYFLLLLFFSIVIPLFDLYHLMIYVIAFVYVLISVGDFNVKFNTKLFSYFLIIFVCFKYAYDCNFTFKFNDINNFNYKNLNNEYVCYSKDINSKMKEYPNSIIIGSSSYYFKIMNDEDIGYLDLINTGNFGYDGDSKFINLIRKNKDCYFFVEMSELDDGRQSMKSGINYIISNGKKIESIGDYDVYVLE